MKKQLAIPGLDQVHKAKLLGVQFTCTLSFTEHVSIVLKLCSQRLHLLKLLRDQGMTRNCLDCIFHSLVLSRIEYVLPVWGGYLNAELTGQINSFLHRCFKYGFCNAVAKVEQLLEKSNQKISRTLSTAFTPCYYPVKTVTYL